MNKVREMGHNLTVYITGSIECGYAVEEHDETKID
jgi:hypothetical protein